MFNPHSPQTAKPDQTEVCQCDLCQETPPQPTLLARLWQRIKRIASLLTDAGRAWGF